MTSSELTSSDLTSSDAPGADRGPADAESIGARIDWGLAAATGKRLARPGPKTTAYTLDAAYAELAEAATRAEAPVREVTGLADGLRVPTTRILDRKEWVDAAAQSMQSMLGAGSGASGPVGLGAGSGASGPDGHGAGSGASGPVGLGAGSGPDATDHDDDGGSPNAIEAALAGFSAKAGGLQAGGLLAFLSGAILGQYDPFTPDPETGDPGVLMVVAPNIISVERSLRVVPSDFRLWVCLHEVTHRVQFSANPWLRQYMVDNLEILTSDSGESTSEIVARITSTLRGSDEKPREKGVLGAMQLLQTPEQFEAFNRMMMLGTLLEGHADHVMDAVGPVHVPTVASIRAAFDKRRGAPRNPVQRIIRALIGMDAKIAQYVRGKAFVDEVVGAVGMETFNTIWTSPETMPRPNEIDEPRVWMQRVL
ncbi:zinc-dependent metalloprotease [Gordonia hankookensis]|uniref:Zinc-dependent metalloprotease n=1 Tax=Gordonia hankookensis TaxID=589403 RepID=A0ABR7W8T7_9ACTN|nr:zinc-dependent metalloprotease [Gordonia hankookensis]MBD1319224.1 zinc-dependent metalloprotease [Gordonia hankookensis]